MSREVFAQPSSPVEESIEAGIRFWGWYLDGIKANSLELGFNMSGVLRTAAETVSLYLPVAMMDRRTTDTIVHGSFSLALEDDGWLHRERFKRVLDELTDDPAKEMEDVSAGVFADEYNDDTKEKIFRLAKLVVQEPPQR